MPIERIQIPISEPVFWIELAYLASYEGPDSPIGSLAFLHKIRVDPLVKHYPEAIAAWERAYAADLPRFTGELVALLEPRRFDLIVQAPSRRNDTSPYAEAIKRRNPDAVNLSTCFEKNETTRAAIAPGLADLVAGIRFSCSPDLRAIRTLLILDDVFSQGLTASALIVHLQRAGLSPRAQVTVGAPLRTFAGQRGRA